MSVLGRKQLCVLGAVLGARSCGGDGGTTPPGPPVDLLKAGDNQSWYFNNPVPTAWSVTAVDVDGRPVPGVAITWAVATGDGTVTPTQSTTNASGVATTTDSIGGSTIQTVSATFTGLAGPVSFPAHATTPPTSAAASVGDNHFKPQNSVVQTGGTSTWDWGGADPHTPTLPFCPTPLT